MLLTTEQLIEQEKLKDEALQVVIKNTETRVDNLKKLVSGINYSEADSYKLEKKNILSDLENIKEKIIGLYSK